MIIFQKEREKPVYMLVWMMTKPTLNNAVNSVENWKTKSPTLVTRNDPLPSVYHILKLNLLSIRIRIYRNSWLTSNEHYVLLGSLPFNFSRIISTSLNSPHSEKPRKLDWRLFEIAHSMNELRTRNRWKWCNSDMIRLNEAFRFCCILISNTQFIH